MEIIGRITADAKATTLKDGRSVVNFSVAINDSYKIKGQERPTRVTQYAKCSYWINPGIAAYLTKGTLVELSGRIGVNVWKNAEGDDNASLTFHTNNIKLHGGKGRKDQPDEVNATPAEPVTADDLPF